MTALDWLAVAGSLIGLALVIGIAHFVTLFCRGCSLVERKDWMEE